MEIPLLHIDAFTSEAFRGNPAAVCLLEAPKPTGWMQKVAAEMNLPITAFVVHWAGVLGKAEMTAYQASARGGVIGVRLVKNDEGDRVFLSGEAITVLRGSLLC